MHMAERMFGELDRLLSLEACDLDLLDVEYAYENAGVERFSDYIKIVSAYIFARIQQKIFRNVESLHYYHLFNGYSFDDFRIDRFKMLEEVNGIDPEDLPEALLKCGFTMDEVYILAAGIMQTAFASYITDGKEGARTWIEIRFLHHPHALIVLKWGMGRIVCEMV